MAVSDEDDPVSRVVAMAVAAQTRLVVEYMNSMRDTIRREIEVVIRAEYAGDRPYIGKGTAARNLMRDELIRRDRAAGMSLRAIARKHHLSKSQVCRVLNEGNLPNLGVRGGD